MNNNCECKNNYNEETYMESFGKDDSEIKNCANCSNASFDNGILICTKFSN